MWGAEVIRWQFALNRDVIFFREDQNVVNMEVIESKGSYTATIRFENERIFYVLKNSSGKEIDSRNYIRVD